MLQGKDKKMELTNNWQFDIHYPLSYVYCLKPVYSIPIMAFIIIWSHFLMKFYLKQFLPPENLSSSDVFYRQWMPLVLFHSLEHLFFCHTNTYWKIINPYHWAVFSSPWPNTASERFPFNNVTFVIRTLFLAIILPCCEQNLAGHCKEWQNRKKHHVTRTQFGHCQALGRVPGGHRETYIREVGKNVLPLDMKSATLHSKIV